MRHAVLTHRFIMGVFLVAMTIGMARAEVKYPCPIDADVWLLGGQSNMEGQDYAWKFPTTPEPNVVNFDMSNTWMEAKDPLHRPYEAVAAIHHTLLMQFHLAANNNDPVLAEAQLLQFKQAYLDTPHGVGPGLSFGLETYKGSGRPIALIPCAHGGTGMDQWDPNLKSLGDNSLYGAMMNRVEMTGVKVKVKGLVWYQGESEVGSDAATSAFEDKFRSFVAYLRDDLQNPNLPVLYVQIARYQVSNSGLERGYEQIREHQRLVSKRRSNIYFTTAIDQPMYDAIHISGSGQRRLGARLAELALTYVYNKPGHGKQIDLESIRVTGARTAKPIIRVHFSGVTGHLKSDLNPFAQFELREPSPAYPTTPQVTAVEFDPQDPAGLNVVVTGPLVGPIKLICAPGIDPVLSVVDDKDMPLPAFGPVAVPWDAEPKTGVPTNSGWSNVE
jgi:sialate O-acetylesterase